MNVSVLGSLKVQRFGREVKISAAKCRLVLAYLSVATNSVISTPALIDELWGEYPPPSSIRTIQTYIYQLRKALQLSGDAAAENDDRSALITRPGGYELQLGSHSTVDVHRFDALVTLGRQQTDQHRYAESAQTLQDALGLWREEPFADIKIGSTLAAARLRLEQTRKAALELRIDAELELGRHRQLIDELYGLALAHPTHEGFAARLVTALHRSDRRVEALDIYHRLRHALQEDLGVSPSSGVQRVYREVLHDDAPPVSARTRVTVRSSGALPPRPRLIGRDRERAAVAAALAGRHHGLRVVEVVGGPGIGTTSLAVDVAHALHDGYPHGAVVLDLRAITVHRSTDAGLLAERLRLAGVPIRSATGIEPVIDEFRRWTADRRLLLIADHLACEELAAALRPAGPESAMVVINQFGPPGQIGDSLVELNPLSHQASRELLGSIIGSWPASEEAAISDLLRFCEGNPLTICAVARWLSCRPGKSVARALRELNAVPDRLTCLWWSGRTIGDSIRYRLQNLSDGAATILATLKGDETDNEGIWPQTVATRLRCELAQVESAFEELTDAHLVDEIRDDVQGLTRAQVRSDLPTAYRPRRIVRLGAARVRRLRPALSQRCED